MSDHARLSPSNHSWVHCPGSVRECEKYPRIPTAAATSGTGSHLLLEECLLKNKAPLDFLDKTIGGGHPDQQGGWRISEDRISRVTLAIEYIEARKIELASQFENGLVEVVSETKSYPGKFIGRDDWYGTCDVTITVKNEKGIYCFLECVDYKDGQRYVEVEENPQLIAYALGKLYECEGPRGVSEIQTIRTTVIQPKLYGNSRVRFVEYSSNELMARLAWLSDAARLTDDENAPLIPDKKDGNDYCYFCRHRENCEALLKSKANKIDSTFDSDDVMFFLKNIEKNAKDLDDDILAKMLDAKLIITEMLANVEKELELRLRNGRRINGYALLPGRKSTKWRLSESEIVQKLKESGFSEEDIFTKVLPTPAQFSKKAIFKDLKKDDFLVSEAGPLGVKKVASDEESVELMFS